MNIIEYLWILLAITYNIAWIAYILHLGASVYICNIGIVIDIYEL